ncbi:hypothetical protein, partial [Kribbella albertanoniae]|uniref:hypothetical protein n=1 Tax=Kribbella albertanoniae TaxID=1266829 RepID=UPI001EE089FF
CGGVGRDGGAAVRRGRLARRSDAAGLLPRWLLAAAGGVTEEVRLGESLAGRPGEVGGQRRTLADGLTG